VRRLAGPRQEPAHPAGVPGNGFLSDGSQGNDNGPAPVLVSEAFARQVFPGESAVGKELLLGRPDPRPARIVGVVGDVRSRGLENEGGPAIYGLYDRAPGYALSFCLKTRGASDPLGLAPDARRALAALDPRQPVDALGSLEQAVGDSVADHRLALAALATFAALALLLATVGVYGVLSHAVGRAGREIAVRVALGAGRRQVAARVAGYAGQILLPGLLTGALAARAASRLLASQLFGIARNGHDDAATFAAGSAILACAALLACLAPAWRAVRVDPRTVLQQE
ncbi:MAG TPA: FtsX-like permease family protein, partial [Thermoanaerobaculia bacterium]|nr:FtsX-like permease family protein [Thermoanaerobaculia bacterium]